MSTKRKRIIRIVCASFVMLLLSMNVHAYETFGYHLTGSWYDGRYYVTSPSYTQNNVTVNYGNIADDAVEAWNNAIDATSSHSLDIELSETTNSNNNDIVVQFIISNEGLTGWRGFTYYYDDDGNAIRPGYYANEDYSYGVAVINTNYVHTDPAWSIQNTMMHEMGHIFGLMHVDTSGPLMYESSASYTELVVPQSDDIAGVRSIYGSEYRRIE